MVGFVEVWVKWVTCATVTTLPLPHTHPVMHIIHEIHA